jgi:riboflavin kinase/FMN adenylyltransferase
MKVLRSTLDIGAVTKGCVLSIGNFDGVHIGHQAIFDVVHTMARERGVKAIAMVFEQHPCLRVGVRRRTLLFHVRA